MKKSILCIISFFFFQIVSAYDIKVDDLYYNINKETKEAQVTFGPWGSYQYRSNEGEYSGSVIIPELISVEGEQYNVTSIDEVAFLKCPKLTDVFIPKTIKSIGIEAFEGCANLNTVTLSDGVCKIGELAFNGTDITNLVIPNSVDSIGSSAFINCKSLESVVVGDGLTTLSEWTFDNCTNLKEVSFSNSLTKIDYYVFRNCTSLTTIDLPLSLVKLGQGVFQGCSSLNNVVIPNSVKFIGNAAFWDCVSLNSISIPNDVEVVEFYAFYNTPWYNTLPDGMVYFGKTAYEYKGEMAGNTKISIEDGTVYVSGQAFYGKDRLVEIVFPTSLSHIGFEALCDCSGLKSIIIPKNVNVIEDEAFASCSNLSTIIVFNENPIKLGFPNSTDTDSNSFVFYGVDKQNCKLYVPEGSVELYKAASEWNEFENILPISSSSINNPKLYDKTNNVYDINGLKRGNKAHKGLNIIRQSNGETKKVIVK